MFKKTFVVLLVTVSSITSIIAQPELFLSKTVDLSPKKVRLLQRDRGVKPQVQSHIPWKTLSKRLYFTKSQFGFQKGTCTDYASSKRPALFMHSGKRLITGNAKERLSKAKELWIKTSKTPQKWSIAVYLPWDDGASSYGHVAYVEQVGENGVIVISDMNYDWKNIVTRRTISADTAAWYID